MATKETKIIISGNTSKYERALRDVKRVNQQTTKTLKKDWNSIKGVMTGVTGKVLALAGVGGMGMLAKSMITAASNLQEVSSKFDVVFKGQEEKAKLMAGVLVESYAMSTREAKQYLSSVQDLLVPMGMASKQAANMSGEIVRLSADLGSFNNQPTAKVMDDVQSALVGNYETMKKYGVVLNATVVQEKALTMGLAGSKDALTAAHKAQAAYQLIVEGSSAAIGDMDRTSGGYANRLKALQAKMEDTAAVIGGKFLRSLANMGPTLEAIFDWMGNKIPLAVDHLAKAFNAIPAVVALVAEKAVGSLIWFYNVLGKMPGRLGEPYRQAAKGLKGFQKELKGFVAYQTKIALAGEQGWKVQEKAAEAYGNTVSTVTDGAVKDIQKVNDALIGESARAWAEAAAAGRKALDDHQKKTESSAKEAGDIVCKTAKRKVSCEERAAGEMLDKYQGFIAGSESISRDFFRDFFTGELQTSSDYFKRWTGNIKMAFADMLYEMAATWVRSGVMNYLTGGTAGGSPSAFGGGGGGGGLAQQGLTTAASEYLKAKYGAAVTSLFGGGLQTTGIATTGSLTTSGGATYAAVSGAGTGAASGSAATSMTGLSGAGVGLLAFGAGVLATQQFAKSMGAYSVTGPNQLDVWLAAQGEPTAYAKAKHFGWSDAQIKARAGGHPGTWAAGDPYADEFTPSIWSNWQKWLTPAQTAWLKNSGIPTAHEGMFVRPDERIIKVQTGEGVLSRRDIASIGGEAGFNALRRGDFGRPMKITVIVGGEEFDARISRVSDNVRVKAERRGLGTRRAYL